MKRVKNRTDDYEERLSLKKTQRGRSKSAVQLKTQSYATMAATS